MAIATDTLDAPAERLPGQFRRHAKTGAPFVADPERTTKETGTKAELIVRCAERGVVVPEKATIVVLQGLLGPRPTVVQYGRPSSLGKQIEDQTNLQKWSERMVALGIASDAELQQAAVELVGLDHESAEFKEAADAVARRAKTVAQAHLAAERGTHHHELTEDVDRDRDPVERMGAGEDLGVPIPVQKALVAAWSAMLTEFDIEILATEASCVDDVWRQAGTLDRVCRLRRDLRFITVTGEYVTLPAGWVGILDIKTGRLRLDRAGFVAYWQGYAVQLASYAQSVRYDPDTDTRSAWEWPIDQHWAVIAHLDVLAALDGEAVCRLVLVDLEAGRHAGALCVAAKTWEKRTDVFSLPLDDLAVRVPVEMDAVSASTPSAAPPAPPGAGPADPTPATEPEPGADTALIAVERAEGTAAHDDTTGEVASPASPVVTPQAQIEAVRARVADDGALVDDGDFDALQRHYAALDGIGRAWIAALTEQSIQGHVSFHARGNRTQRRYSIIRALVLMCQRGDHDDDTVRGLLEPIIGDCAQFPSVPVGHLVGSLSHVEAAQFAGLVDGRYSILVREDGKPTLHVAA